MESSEWQQVLKIVALCSITIGIPDTPVSRRAYGEVIVTATEIPLGGDRYHSVATDHRGALRLMTHKLSARPSPKASDRTKKKKRREK